MGYELADGLLVAEVSILLVDGAADLGVGEGGKQCEDNALVQAGRLDGFDEVGPGPGHHVEAPLGLLGLAVGRNRARVGQRVGRSGLAGSVTSSGR
jgi:hypothetical protein